MTDTVFNRLVNNARGAGMAKGEFESVLSTNCFSVYETMAAFRALSDTLYFPRQVFVQANGHQYYYRPQDPRADTGTDDVVVTAAGRKYIRREGASGGAGVEGLGILYMEQRLNDLSAIAIPGNTSAEVVLGVRQSGPGARLRINLPQLAANPLLRTLRIVNISGRVDIQNAVVQVTIAGNGNDTVRLKQQANITGPASSQDWDLPVGDSAFAIRYQSSLWRVISAADNHPTEDNLLDLAEARFEGEGPVTVTRNARSGNIEIDASAAHYEGDLNSIQVDNLNTIGQLQADRQYIIDPEAWQDTAGNPVGQFDITLPAGVQVGKVIRLKRAGGDTSGNLVLNIAAETGDSIRTLTALSTIAESTSATVGLVDGQSVAFYRYSDLQWFLIREHGDEAATVPNGYRILKYIFGNNQAFTFDDDARTITVPQIQPYQLTEKDLYDVAVNVFQTQGGIGRTIDNDKITLFISDIGEALEGVVLSLEQMSLASNIIERRTTAPADIEQEVSLVATTATTTRLTATPFNTTGRAANQELRIFAKRHDVDLDLDNDLPLFEGTMQAFAEATPIAVTDTTTLADLVYTGTRFQINAVRFTQTINGERLRISLGRRINGLVAAVVENQDHPASFTSVDLHFVIGRTQVTFVLKDLGVPIKLWSSGSNWDEDDIALVTGDINGQTYATLWRAKRQVQNSTSQPVVGDDWEQTGGAGTGGGTITSSDYTILNKTPSPGASSIRFTADEMDDYDEIMFLAGTTGASSIITDFPTLYAKTNSITNFRNSGSARATWNHTNLTLSTTAGNFSFVLLIKYPRGTIASTIAIGNNAVRTINLRDGSVTTTKILDLSVTTSKIADGAVTKAKLAPGAAQLAAWVSGTSYEVGDEVENDGNHYKCLRRITGGTPSTTEPHDDVVTNSANPYWVNLSASDDPRLPNAVADNMLLGVGSAWLTRTKAQIKTHLDIDDAESSITAIRSDITTINSAISNLPSGNTRSDAQVQELARDAVGPALAGGTSNIKYTAQDAANTIDSRAPEPKGAWASGSSYIAGDTVTANNAVFRCILEIANSTTSPETDATHWALFFTLNTTGFATTAALTALTTRVGNNETAISSLQTSVASLSGGGPARSDDQVRELARDSVSAAVISGGGNIRTTNNDSANTITMQAPAARGAWVRNTQYVAGDTARSNNRVYRCLNAVVSTTRPESDSTNWSLEFSYDTSGFASASSVTALTTTVSNLTTTVNAKANQSAVTSLTTQVNTNTTNITSLQTSVASLQGGGPARSDDQVRELARDAVAAAANSGGGNVAITNNDSANTITLRAPAARGAWARNTSYIAGDTAVSNNAVYRCLQAVVSNTRPESDSTNWALEFSVNLGAYVTTTTYNALANTVAGHTTSISNLNTAVAARATTSALNTLRNTVNALSTTVGTKVDSADVTSAINTQVKAYARSGGGAVGVGDGGTGATSALGARNSLGASNGRWPVTLGGTGSNSSSGARANLQLDLEYVETSSNYTVSTTQRRLWLAVSCSGGNRTVTLPNVSSDFEVVIQKIAGNTNTLTIDAGTSGSIEVEGGGTRTVTIQEDDGLVVLRIARSRTWRGFRAANSPFRIDPLQRQLIVADDNVDYITFHDSDNTDVADAGIRVAVEGGHQHLFYDHSSGRWRVDNGGTDGNTGGQIEIALKNPYRIVRSTSSVTEFTLTANDEGRIVNADARNNDMVVKMPATSGLKRGWSTTVMNDQLTGKVTVKLPDNGIFIGSAGDMRIHSPAASDDDGDEIVLGNINDSVTVEWATGGFWSIRHYSKGGRSPYTFVAGDYTIDYDKDENRTIAVDSGGAERTVTFPDNMPNGWRGKIVKVNGDHNAVKLVYSHATGRIGGNADNVPYYLYNQNDSVGLIGAGGQHIVIDEYSLARSKFRFVGEFNQGTPAVTERGLPTLIEVTAADEGYTVGVNAEGTHIRRKLQSGSTTNYENETDDDNNNILDGNDRTVLLPVMGNGDGQVRTGYEVTINKLAGNSNKVTIIGNVLLDTNRDTTEPDPDNPGQTRPRTPNDVLQTIGGDNFFILVFRNESITLVAGTGNEWHIKSESIKAPNQHYWEPIGEEIERQSTWTPQFSGVRIPLDENITGTIMIELVDDYPPESERVSATTAGQQLFYDRREAGGNPCGSNRQVQITFDQLRALPRVKLPAAAMGAAGGQSEDDGPTGQGEATGQQNRVLDNAQRATSIVQQLNRRGIFNSGDADKIAEGGRKIIEGIRGNNVDSVLDGTDILLATVVGAIERFEFQANLNNRLSLEDTDRDDVAAVVRSIAAFTPTSATSDSYQPLWTAADGTVYRVKYNRTLAESIVFEGTGAVNSLGLATELRSSRIMDTWSGANIIGDPSDQFDRVRTFRVWLTMDEEGGIWVFAGQIPAVPSQTGRPNPSPATTAVTQNLKFYRSVMIYQEQEQ